MYLVSSNALFQPFLSVSFPFLSPLPPLGLEKT